ncbi:MAG: hypothetical protein IKP67_04250 [Spirochaetales bacterium]|nr:hypothetical protein [Spirochaetales bacterium]
MKEALVDISVLLVFFARPDTFAEVFAQVRQARPARLFLYQDGPREDHPDDIDNIAKCRGIAADIDWDCEVKTFYQDKNVGCDPSGYIAHTWAFSQTDKCIVLEDDVVPSVSFFAFCKAMLDKYEDDERVMLISGFNPQEITPNVASDYFFSCTTWTWGWASWSRVVRQWDGKYNFLDRENDVVRISAYMKKHHVMTNFINMCTAHKASGRAHFETILIANQYLHDGLTIVPKKNMVNNIGVTGNSTHYASDLNLIPKGYRRIFTMKRYELDADKISPPNDVDDYHQYKNDTYRIYGWGHPFVKIWRLIESSFYRLLHGDLQGMFADVRDKLKKFFEKRVY